VTVEVKLGVPENGLKLAVAPDGRPEAVSKEEFMQHYHQRSNAEITFSMLKRKFQGKLMLKNEIGQTNEALAKVLCHNITVLIHEAFEGNAKIHFQELAHLFSSLHINSGKSLEKV